MKNSYRTWIEIDSKAFNHNISELRNLISPQTALGVVAKADAYGHGLELIGTLCQENSDVSWLFTAGLAEAVRLRQAGVTKPILVLAYIDDDMRYLIDYDITCSVCDMHSARELAAVGRARKQKISVHIKIDTGMSRLGFMPADMQKVLTALNALEYLDITGIFTHLSDTNNSDYSFTKSQLQRFNDTTKMVELLLKKKLFNHVLASGALHLTHEYRYDCVRVGSNVYGLWKSPLQQQRLTALNPEISLVPLLTWKTRIIDIKHINAGDAVGYHRTFIATGPMKIAILPIGYYDGYPRALSHKGHVLVRGAYAPVIGIISMNLMVVDVSGIGSARIDDEVVLCGNFIGVSAHDLAIVTDSLHLEFLTRISPYVARVVI